MRKILLFVISFIISLLITSSSSKVFARDTVSGTESSFSIDAGNKNDLYDTYGKEIIKATNKQGKNVVTLDESLNNRTAELSVGTIILLRFPGADRNTEISITPSRGIVEMAKGKYHLPKDDIGILEVVGKGSATIHVKTKTKFPENIIMNAASQTYNWSGYSRTTGGPFTSVSSIWKVPTSISCTMVDTYSSAWTGIDGNGNNDLIQTGTDSNCISGNPSYGAWWEILPNTATTIGNSVSAGDTMYATISKNSTNWTITLKNLTQNWTFSTNQTYSGPQSTAEWILEAPTVNGSIAILTDYSTTTFLNNSQNGTNPNHSYATDSVDMIDQNSNVISSVSTSNSTLNAFSVAFGSTAPASPAGWMSAGTTSVASTTFAAAKLSSGKVYLTGGEGSAPSPTHFNTVSEYNPTTNSWTQKASMLTRRYAHTATPVIASGGVEKLLVVGGRGGWSGWPGDWLKSAEVYNPSNNSWTATPDMASYHAYHTATLLSDGKVLIAGGMGNFGVRTTAVDVYDPVANTWTAKTPMPVATTYSSATLLQDGKVLFVGGQVKIGSSYVATTSAEFYDPVADTWSQAPSLNTARQVHKAVLLTDGSVMVIGGTTTINGTGVTLASAEIWAPGSSTWTTVSPMFYPRSGHTATFLSDGRVIVTGGSTSTAEIYDSLNNQWEILPSMVTARVGHGASLLDNGRLLIFNGLNSTGYINTAEYFTP